MRQNRNHKAPHGLPLRGLAAALVSLLALPAFAADPPPAATPSTLPAAAPAEGAAAPAISAPLDPASATSLPGVTLGGQAADKPARKKTAPLRVKSLFFSPEELTALYNALDVYSRFSAGQNNGGDQGEDFIKQLEGGAKAQDLQLKIYSYPQFFLESLVYHGPDDWTVRINGEVLTKDITPPKLGLRVLGVDKDQVTLEWKPLIMDKLSGLDGEHPDSRVKIDNMRGTIDFTLLPNQTFSSYTMSVLEGKVQPVMMDAGASSNKNGEDSSDIDLGKPEPKPMKKAVGPPPKVPSMAPPPVPAAKDESGLGGLLNMYQGMKGDGNP